MKQVKFILIIYFVEIIYLKFTMSKCDQYKSHQWDVLHFFCAKCEKLSGVYIQSRSPSWLATFQMLSSFVHLVTTVLTRQFHAIFRRSLRYGAPAAHRSNLLTDTPGLDFLPSPEWLLYFHQHFLRTNHLPSELFTLRGVPLSQLLGNINWHSGSQPASSKGSHTSCFLSHSRFLPFLLLFLHGVNPYWKFQQGVCYAVTTSGKGLFIFEPEYQRTEECPLPWGQSGEGGSSTRGDSCAHWAASSRGTSSSVAGGPRGEDRGALGPYLLSPRWLWEPPDWPEGTFYHQTKGGGTDTINLYLKGNLNLCRHWW